MGDPLARLEGKYELLEKIQEGGMGAIYKVRHRLLDELRVVKIIRPHLQETEGIEERFVREAKAAARLDHRNIARIFDFTLDDDRMACIVMEYIHGVTLGQLIRSQHLPPLPLTLEIARQSLAAIGYVHNQRIVHRDISPDNLMLTRDASGNPLMKLIDLGLVKTMEGGGSRLTGTGIFVGKFRYAAPELFDSNSGGESRSSDLYAFGLVLYELLTGRFPIAGENPSSLIAGHLFRAPLEFQVADPEGQVPDQVRHLVRRTLAKSPADRFASAEEMIQALGPGDPEALQTPEVLHILELAERWPEQHGVETRGSVISTLEEGAEVNDAARIEERIEAHILEGDIEGARRILAAQPAGADTAALSELRRRLDEIETIANRPRIHKLVSEAHRHTEADRREEALTLLEEAHRLGPDDVQVLALLEAARRAVERHRAESDRLALVAMRVEAVEEALLAGSLEDAARQLREGEELLGADPRFDSLRVRLRELSKDEAEREAAAGVEALVAEARRLAQAEDFDGASRYVAEALERMPVHAGALAIQASVEACLEARRQEEAGDDSLERTLSDIRHLLETGRAEEAAARVEEATAVFGDQRALEELRFATAEARLAESEAPTISLATQGPWLDQDQGLAHRLEEIRALAAEGKAGTALGVLQRAVHEHGDVEELRALRAELGQALLAQDEARRGEEDMASVVARRPPVQEPSAVERPPSAGGTELADLTLGGRVQPEIASGRFDEVPVGKEHGSESTLPRTKTVDVASHGVGRRVELGSEPGVREIASGPMELGFGDPSSRPERSNTPSRRSTLPSAGQTSRNMVLNAVILVVLLLAVAYGVSRFAPSSSSPVEETPTPAETPVPVADLPPGYLALDGSPWCEVLSIRRLDGGDPPPLVPSRFTPVVFTLPPGGYVLELRGPDGEEKRPLEVEIVSGERLEQRVEWRAVESGEYFEAVGF